MAHDAGADFIVTPHLNLTLMNAAQQQRIPIIPGCYTPSEMQAAHEAGATAIKLFPVSTLAPSYIKAVLAPLPHLHIIAVGGVNQDNAKAYLDSGAMAVGVGTQLFGEGDFADKNVRERVTQSVQGLLARCGC